MGKVRAGAKYPSLVTHPTKAAALLAPSPITRGFVEPGGSNACSSVVNGCPYGIEDLEPAGHVDLFEDKREGGVVTAHPLHRRFEV